MPRRSPKIPPLGLSPIAFMWRTILAIAKSSEDIGDDTPEKADKSRRQSPESLRTSDLGIDLVRAFEGLRLEAYQDSVGIWTIGYGHTRTARAGVKVTRDRARELLREDLVEAEGAVKAYLGEVELRQHEFDALVSFAFNLGGSALDPKGSTLARRLLKGDYGVTSEFPRWAKAGGTIQPGLVFRRRAEAHLWELGSLNFDTQRRLAEVDASEA